VSERIDVAKLREQFTLWPEVLGLIDGLTAAHRWMIANDDVEDKRVEELAGALAPFDFGDA
jgi:hypothetical protein